MTARHLSMVGMLVMGFVAGSVYGASLPHAVAGVLNTCADQASNAKGGATYHGVRIVVQSFRNNPHAQSYLPPKPGNTLYVAHVLIANQGHTNYHYAVQDLTLQDSSGNTYTFRNNQYLATVMVAGTLAPGQSIAGDITYEAPLHGRFHMLWVPGQDYSKPFLTVPLPPTS